MILFLSTFPSISAARKFGKAVVTGKLAACVNIVSGVSSIYIWKNKLRDQREVLLIGKTTSRGFKKIKTQIKTLHPYETPELLAFKSKDGLDKYIRWVEKSVKQ